MYIMRIPGLPIRSVVLDAPTAPDTDIASADVKSQLDGLTRLFAMCEADVQCRSAFPKLKSSFLGAFEKLNLVPLDIGKSTIDGRTFVRDVVEAMEDINLFPRVPAIIAAAFNEDGKRVAKLMEKNETPLPAGLNATQRRSIGLTLSIYCGEMPYSRFSTATIQSDEPWPIAITESLTPTYFTACRTNAWPVPKVPQASVSRVASGIPTLILVGAMDPITSVIEGRRAAAGLSNSRIVVAPFSSHGMSVYNKCTQAVMAAFLNSAKVDIDTSCIDKEEPIVFLLR
jgi:pimeloyl-ACP methyl ester carboxylesterase